MREEKTEGRWDIKSSERKRDTPGLGDDNSHNSHACTNYLAVGHDKSSASKVMILSLERLI